jgi:hypothetical protein
MVKSRRITFQISGDDVVGDLYVPTGAAGAPAVVVAGPMTSVKEQVTGVYARAFAEAGIAALSIDHRHFGESGGMPRQFEYFKHKIEDLHAAVRALAQQPEIDAARLGLAGVCLGCGYAAWAAVNNTDVKALGLVVGYYRHPIAMREKDSDGFDGRIAQGVAARQRFEATGICDMIPAAALEGDAAMQTADTVDYYTRRAKVANYVNAFAVMSREHFLPFNVQDAAASIHQPVAMVHSENALSPHWARDFHRALAGEKSIDWVRSAGQTDFYDDPALVAHSVASIAPKLHAWL